MTGDSNHRGGNAAVIFRLAAACGGVRRPDPERLGIGAADCE